MPLKASARGMESGVGMEPGVAWSHGDSSWGRGALALILASALLGATGASAGVGGVGRGSAIGVVGARDLSCCGLELVSHQHCLVVSHQHRLHP